MTKGSTELPTGETGKDVSNNTRENTSTSIDGMKKEGASPGTGGHLMHIFSNLIKFFFLVISVWLAFFSLYHLFPYAHPGSRIVYMAKLEALESSRIFPDTASKKVVIFGNSKVLSSFVPDLFDELSNDRTVSFNCGLPDAEHFEDELRKMIESGNRPDIVLLTVPWENESQDLGIFRPFRSDKKIMDILFPFRKMVMEMYSFFSQARKFGGAVANYKRGREIANQLFLGRMNQRNLESIVHGLKVYCET